MRPPSDPPLVANNDQSAQVFGARLPSTETARLPNERIRRQPCGPRRDRFGDAAGLR